MPFQPGKSGNPAGRPLGAKQKLATELSNALLSDFTEHGKSVIERVRNEDPATYLRVIASVIPREIAGHEGGEIVTRVIYGWDKSTQE